MMSVLQQRDLTILVSTRRPWTVCLRWLRQAMVVIELPPVVVERKHARNLHRQAQPQHSENLDAAHDAPQDKMDEATATRSPRNQLARMTSHHV